MQNFENIVVRLKFCGPRDLSSGDRETNILQFCKHFLRLGDPLEGTQVTCAVCAQHSETFANIWEGKFSNCV